MQGGSDAAICDAAICTRGVATQPLSPSVRMQTTSGRQEKDRFDNIGLVLDIRSSGGVVASAGLGWTKPDAPQRFSLAASAGGSSITGICEYLVNGQVFHRVRHQPSRPPVETLPY